MNETQKEIMRLLKDNFEKVVGKKKPFQCGSGARNYYLCNLKDNLIEPMSDKTLLEYGHGKGNEIFSGKMNALRSSSALTYNIFGNHPVKIDKKDEEQQIGEGLYEVEFEKQFPTLIPSVSKMPANLDAFLINKEKEEAIAVEMKMLEWVFNEPGKLKKAYLDSDNYIYEEAGKVFVNVAGELIKEEEKDMDLDKYSCKYERYDAFQMFKHAVACYNECKRRGSEKINKLTLVNCVWTLSNPNLLSDECRDEYNGWLKEECKEFKGFLEIMKPFVAEFKKIGVEFAIEFIEVKDMINFLNKTPAERKYLERYIFDKE